MIDFDPCSATVLPPTSTGIHTVYDSSYSTFMFNIPVHF